MTRTWRGTAEPREGGDALELAERFGLTVRGVDPVRRHIDLATESARRAGLASRVSFHLGTAERLPLLDESVDFVWSREALMFASLADAFAEFRRVLRPGGRVFVYQVFTGSRMTDGEAVAFWRDAIGAYSVRPEQLEQLASGAGFSLLDRSDLGGEWGEWGEERSGAAGRRLVHAARLLRDPDRYVAEFGESNHRIMLGDCLWHVYRMIGKLHGAALTFERP